MHEIDKNSLAVIFDAIQHACNTMRSLAWEEHPLIDPKNEDLKEIYHDLTGLMLKVHVMLKAKKMEKEGLLHEENTQDG